MCIIEWEKYYERLIGKYNEGSGLCTTLVLDTLLNFVCGNWGGGGRKNLNQDVRFQGRESKLDLLEQDAGVLENQFVRFRLEFKWLSDV